MRTSILFLQTMLEIEVIYSEASISSERTLLELLNASDVRIVFARHPAGDKRILLTFFIE